MPQSIYTSIIKSKATSKKLFAILVDPDKFESNKTIALAETAKVDFIMVGGSLLANGNFE
jgi:heptaprenylglyceryl phosphate synthase